MEVDDEDSAAEASQRGRSPVAARSTRILGWPVILDRSTGSTNDSLVDHLKRTGSVRSSSLEAAFRAVDRRKFLPGADERSAEVYNDAPVRIDHFHMSQPSLYADALEHLDLKPGLSFLNVGSGTGYFSSIVSEITGPALHHGVDLHTDLLEHAREMVRQQGKHHIEFFQVNVHDLDLAMSPRYDRIYVGACAGGASKKILGLLQVGGVLVGPFETSSGQYIRRVVRKSASSFEVKNLKQVSFGRLVPSEDSSRPPFTLPSPPWTPETHASHSSGFRAAVLEVLLCTTKPESPAHIVPRDIFVKHVFGFMHPRWFSDVEADKYTERLDGAEEQEMHDEGSFDEDVARLQVLRTLALFARQQADREEDPDPFAMRLQNFLRLLQTGQRDDSDDEEETGTAETHATVESGAREAVAATSAAVTSGAGYSDGDVPMAPAPAP
eukprot:TRINITY_DN78847_c0_g1_i1.p1 TRINITY_DN78847_c0_g1~~TRINITY_DN78847_c0_g1_i1.p1  ORF type:complete len:449 (-),score=97.09 TRINITY_DN78847_c0_g1_i1:45-1361(-)